MKEWQDIFRFYCEERNECFLADNLTEAIRATNERMEPIELSRWKRLEEDFIKRGVRIRQSNCQVKIVKVVNEDNFVKVFYRIKMIWELLQGNHTYEQSWVENRLCLLKKDDGWLVVEDSVVEEEGIGLLNIPATVDDMDLFGDSENENKASLLVRQHHRYDRDKAVEYAEEYWNSYNPKFKHFEVNCTNYVSQCLWAGGAPMEETGDRASGWWYRFSDDPNWSFSWAVAHSMRWYLPSSSTGLRGREVSAAKDLEPGDVICYDFNGDGRWQHTTFVVTRDAQGEPLVNAHTTNSRHRYWAYRDSHAWTENTKYKFIKIVNDF